MLIDCSYADYQKPLAECWRAACPICGARPAVIAGAGERARSGDRTRTDAPRRRRYLCRRCHAQGAAAAQRRRPRLAARRPPPTTSGGLPPRSNRLMARVASCSPPRPTAPRARPRSCSRNGNTLPRRPSCSPATSIPPTPAERLVWKRRFLHLCDLALGGTAVGTGLNTHPDWAKNVAQDIDAFMGCAVPHGPEQVRGPGLARRHPLRPRRAEDPRGLAHQDRQRRALARGGSRCGLGEIRIPENEPGSSIMPGKVNPTQCEAMTMVARRSWATTSRSTSAGARATSSST